MQQFGSIRSTHQGKIFMRLLSVLLLIAIVFSIFPLTIPVFATSNEEIIFQYLRGTMQLNTAAVCGVLANIKCESNFDPHALGDSGTSYGICQWHSTRWTNLKNYCNSNGYDWTSLNGQLHFLEHELTNNYTGVYNTLTSVSDTADGAYNAAYKWCYSFEVPANYASVSVTRGNLAKNTYYPKYASTFQYNGSVAAQYAQTWGKSRNPAWSDYSSAGGDCANFVSQCLIAGGLEMDSDWYWHSYTNKSSSWTVAPSLMNYLVVKKGYQAIESPSASQVVVGDILFYDWGGDGSYDHAGICSKVEGGKPFVCAHSSDKVDSAYWTMNAKKVAVVKMDGSFSESSTENGTHSTLRIGSSGSEVRLLQTMLNAVNNANLTIDGAFGPATETAVKNYQAQKGIQVDGICGPQTWAALETEYNNLGNNPIPTPPTGVAVTTNQSNYAYGDSTSFTATMNGADYYTFSVYNYVGGTWSCEFAVNLDTTPTTRSYSPKASGSYRYDVKAINSVGASEASCYFNVSVPEPEQTSTQPSTTEYWVENGITWQADFSSKTLTIYGSGELTPPREWRELAFSDESYEAQGFRAEVETLIIEEGITSVGHTDGTYGGIFFNCPNLKTVYLPDSLTYIVRFAFNSCPKLQNVVLGNNLAYIGQAAFFECSSLSYISIPDSVSFIGAGAFKNTDLKSVTLGNSVSSIGEEAFCTGSDALESFSVAADNLYFCSVDGILYDRNITELIQCPNGKAEVNLPDTVTLINRYAFRDCKKIQKIVLPESVTTIGMRAFIGCNNLREIYLPEGLESIDSWAFEDCESLTTITLPSTLKSTGATYSAFVSENLKTYIVLSRNLEDSNFLGKLKYYKEIDVMGGGYGYDGTNTGVSVFYYPDSKTAEYFSAQKETYKQDYNWNFYELADPEALIEPNIEFVDVVRENYYFTAVLWAYNHYPQITSGLDATHFGPNATCTREQVVTFLWAAFDKEEPASLENPFSDVPNGAWYLKPVLWAKEKKITSGVGGSLFGVGQSCTRAQVVTFLWAAAGKPAPTSMTNPFTDVSENDYFYKAVLWAVEHGITKGVSADSFAPADTCTRAQVVTFLYKAVGE